MPVDLIVTPPPIIELRVTPIARVAIGVQDPHAGTHKAGGSDEIDVDGLHGVLADPQLIEVAHNGTLVGSRTRLNFAAGLNVELTVTEGANAIDVEIASTGEGGGGGETVTAGAGLTKSGSTLDVVAADPSIVVGTDSIRIGVLQSDTSHGTRGGGSLHPLATSTVAGFMGPADRVKLDSTESIAAGAGLTKSGSTLDVVAADPSIVVAADSIRVGVLQSDASHGARGGGSLHPLATSTVAGFMAPADRSKLDSVAADAVALSSATPSTITVGTSIPGTDPGASHGDHKHGISTGTPVSIGTVNAEGIGTALARAQHTHDHGSQTIGTHHAIATSTVAGFMDTADRTKLDSIATGADVTLSALATATGPVNVNDQNIVNLKSPTAANHAANKAYVDSVAQGLNVKAACKLLAVSNHTLSGLSGLIDNVGLSSGDRVLAIGQTNPAQNGIYTATSGVWPRAVDADSSAEVTSGMFAFVTQGQVYSDTGWILTTDDPITVGTTPLVFTQFSGTGTVVAGAGIARTGNTFDIVASDTSIVVAADSIRVGTISANQHGTLGGGPLHAPATQLQDGFLTAADKTKIDNLPATFEVVSAGAGLTKSGSTVNVVAANGSITVAADSITVGVLQTDAMHGARGGGTQHPAAVAGSPGTAGFITGTSQLKLDNLPANADNTATALANAVSTISVNLQRITNLGTPTSGFDATTKDYVDKLAGIVKAPVRVVATSNITTSFARTIDGIAVQTGDRVLCIAQTSPINNGIYRVDTAGAWSRATDADTPDKVPAGMLVIATQGTANSDTVWILTTDYPQPGVTDLTFALLSGAPATLAGAGLTYSAGQYHVGTDPTGAIVVGTDNIQLGTISASQHGLQSAEDLHALATASSAGFISGASQAKLDAFTLFPGQINGFRLSGSSTSSITPTGTNPNTLYLVPHTGNHIALHSGSRWIIYSPLATVSLPLSGLTQWALYDVFAYWNGNTITLERLQWTNTTTRATAIVRFDGVWVKSGDVTRRYLGTFRASSSTTTIMTPLTGSDGSSSQVGIWNVDNRVAIPMQWTHVTSWTITPANTWMRWRNTGDPGFEYVIGVQCDPINVQLLGSCWLGGAAGDVIFGISTDNAGTLGGTRSHFTMPANTAVPQHAFMSHLPTIGLNSNLAMVRSAQTTVAIEGTGAMSGQERAGMTGIMWA